MADQFGKQLAPIQQTVARHQASFTARLNLHSRTAFIKLAMRAGLIALWELRDHAAQHGIGLADSQATLIWSCKMIRERVLGQGWRMRMGRSKFIIGGLLILAAVIYLIVSSTQASAEYFLTVDELKQQEQDVVGRNLRVSGAVVGDSIQYDPQTLTLTFKVAHVPGDTDEVESQGGLAAALHAAVTDPDRAQITVQYTGPKPDLLKNEAQAIMTGQIAADGVFHADELLLKCPTKYEEAVPGQAAAAP